MEILLFIFFVVVFIALLVGNNVYKKFKSAKKAVQDAADLKEQRLRNETGRQRQQYSMKPQSKSTIEEKQEESPAQSGPSSASDEKNEEPQAQQSATPEKRIFNDDEGEYVEFEEVH